MIDSHSLNLFRLVLVCFTILALAGNSGCSTTSAAKANSPTGGISLQMSIKGKDNLAALYRVEQDGSIHFGGGQDAQLNKTSWTGQLTQQDVEQLRASLDEHGWFTAEPASSSIDADRKYRIDLRWPGGNRNFKVTGKGLMIAPIEDLLVKFANRRHDLFLESLPKASEPPD